MGAPCLKKVSTPFKNMTENICTVVDHYIEMDIEI